MKQIKHTSSLKYNHIKSSDLFQVNVFGQLHVFCVDT